MLQFALDLCGFVDTQRDAFWMVTKKPKRHKHGFQGYRKIRVAYPSILGITKEPNRHILWSLAHCNNFGNILGYVLLHQFGFLPFLSSLFCVFGFLL